jgi:uncharacterized repeat protein (TIGR04076 family)
MRSSHVWTVAYLGIVVVAIPIAIFHIHKGLYAQAFEVSAAALLGMLIIAQDGLRKPVEEITSSLELHDSVPTPFVPAAIGVVEARGTCPLGFQIGQVFSLDRQGQVLPSICQGAIAAISPALQAPLNGELRQVCCHCPVESASLTFIVSSRPEAA